MSVQHTPPPVGAMFLAPVTVPDAAAGSGPHHPRPEPAGYLCSCGKIREACVHDEVRELWHGVTGR